MLYVYLSRVSINLDLSHMNEVEIRCAVMAVMSVVLTEFWLHASSLLTTNALLTTYKRFREWCQYLRIIIGARCAMSFANKSLNWPVMRLNKCYWSHWRS